MVGPSKILTVSYGTFSCTLEGFDDSFSTMKAIAEYFRDLAADDRYFGAEPPTPDAEMLTRIAQREVARRVEARMDASGITLRTGAALDPDAEEDADESVAPIEPAMPPAARAVPMAPLAAPAEPVTVFGDFADQDISVAVTSDAAGRGTGAEAGDHVQAFAAPAPATPVIDESVATVTLQPDADSVAAKLQRIRAVVGQHRVDLDIGDDAGEDDSIGSDPLDDDSDNQALHDALGGIDIADDADVASADQADEDQAVDPQNDEPASEDRADEIDSIGAMMARVSPAYDDVDDNLADHADRPDVDPADANDTAAEADEARVSQTVAIEMPTPRARVIRMKRSDFERAVARGRLEAETPEDPAEAEGDDWVNRPELPDLAILDGINDLDDFAVADDRSGLSAEEEAELLEELADVERDTGDGDDDAWSAEDMADDVETDDADLDLTGADDADADKDGPSDDDATAAAHDPRPGRAILDTEPDADEAAMSRILSQTDAELREPEGNRRRQAIAQLKAAVAATEAARRMGEPARATDKAENAFRDDLDQVVRPRRARPDGQHRADAERPRPAPLKLVASQRIDMPVEETALAPALVTPVRPRRVQIEAIAPVEADVDVGSFAEYVKIFGATSLQDLLEAAAAYTAFVEGMDDFSRPEIMRKVRQLSPEDFSREDGLRSFGTLLRQGRIAKIRNGRFQISDQTRFRPEAIAARG